MSHIPDDQASATKKDIHDILSVIMGAIGNVETRFDGLEKRFDGLETRFDGLENSLDTKLNDLEHRLLLSNEQTRQDIIDMYKDTLSSHDDRITTLELMARAPRAA